MNSSYWRGTEECAIERDAHRPPPMDGGAALADTAAPLPRAATMPIPETPSDGPPSGRLARYRASWDLLSANVRGSIWMVLSSLVFAVMATCIKLLGQDLPVIEILFFRQMFVILVVLPAIARGFPTVLVTSRWPVHLTRALLAFVAMTAGFTALVHLPLAEATAISFARTLFTTILAVVFLHEVVGWRRWTATLVGFLGVVVVARPSPEQFNEYALLALLSACFVAALQIALRSLAQTERPVTIMAYQNVCLSLLLAGPAAYLWVTPTWEQVAFLAAIGVLMSVSVGSDKADTRLLCCSRSFSNKFRAYRALPNLRSAPVNWASKWTSKASAMPSPKRYSFLAQIFENGLQ